MPQSLNNKKTPVIAHCKKTKKRKNLSFGETNKLPASYYYGISVLYIFLKKANSGEGKQACACPEAQLLRC